MIELRYNKNGKLEYRTSGTTPNKPSQEAVDKLRSIIGSNADISVHPDSITHWNEWKIVPSVEKQMASPAHDGLHTERITLEVTQEADRYTPPSEIHWEMMLRQLERGGSSPGESVRVVSEWDQIRESYDRVSREEGIKALTEEITSLNKEVDRLTGERDAAKAREAIVRDRMRFWFEQYALREEALKKQDARVAQLEAEKNTLLESEMWGVNCKPSASNADPVAWRYKGEPWFDGSRWHDKYELAADERLAKWKDKDALPLYAAPWLTEEERETLLRISYGLDYAQFATSADFIRSLLARLTPKAKEASND